uniref:Taste receptor type 2 n=1 Tax=Oryctolagus cuniculus TaxID=9986 RepID=G1TRI2_RABIT
SVYIILHVIILGFIIGIVSNGFIALVNLIDWIKRRKISSVDQILSALAVSRIGLMCVILLNKLTCVINPVFIFSEIFLKMIYITWAVANHFNIWLTTTLSIFYFLKIVNFSNPAFLYLKQRVEKVVSVILLVSLVLLFSHVALINVNIHICIGGYERNMTCSCNSKDPIHLSRLFLLSYMMFTIIPFTVSLATFLLLILSLWRHLRKMQLSTLGSRDASTKAHFQSLQTMVALLLLYAVFFLVLIIQSWSFDSFLEKHLIIMICYALEMIFFFRPLMHSDSGK